MNNRFNYLFISTATMLILFSLPYVTYGQVAKVQEVISLRDGLKEMLQNHGAANLKKLTVNVDSEKATEIAQKHRVDASGSFTVYQGLEEEGNVIGSVVIINEQGKEGPLQLLVAIRPDGVIYDIGFTVFGEDKGSSALSWNYLKQFIDKTPAEPLTLGTDIDGISGATWTSESVAAAVKRAAVVFGEFFL